MWDVTSHSFKILFEITYVSFDFCMSVFYPPPQKKKKQKKYFVLVDGTRKAPFFFKGCFL